MKHQGESCGGRRGSARSRRGHRFRQREEKALPPTPPPTKRSPALAVDLEWALRELAVLPGPWEPDIDNPEYDAQANFIDGSWTGKVYTGRRGSWCPYLDGEGGHHGYRTARIILALCVVVNHLPGLVKLAREALAAQREDTMTDPHKKAEDGAKSKYKKR